MAIEKQYEDTLSNEGIVAIEVYLGKLYEDCDLELKRELANFLLRTNQRFGIGWYAGAHYAANEDNITIQFNAAHYEYLGTFGPSDEYKAKVAGWYNSGVEIVHAAAGGAGFSVIAAAKEVEGGNKWVVGVDKDQAADGEVVISSAIKGVGEAAYEALEQFYSEKGFCRW